jgi:hypothetical protein
MVAAAAAVVAAAAAAAVSVTATTAGYRSRLSQRMAVCIQSPQWLMPAMAGMLALRVE